MRYIPTKGKVTLQTVHSQYVFLCDITVPFNTCRRDLISQRICTQGGPLRNSVGRHPRACQARIRLFFLESESLDQSFHRLFSGTIPLFKPKHTQQRYAVPRVLRLATLIAGGAEVFKKRCYRSQTLHRSHRLVTSDLCRNLRTNTRRVLNMCSLK